MNIRNKPILFSVVLIAVIAVFTIVSLKRSNNITAEALKYSDWTGINDVINQDIIQSMLLCNVLYNEFELKKDSRSYQAMLLQMEKVIAGTGKVKIALYDNKKLTHKIGEAESAAVKMERVAKSYFANFQKFHNLEDKFNKILDKCYYAIKKTNSESRFGVDPDITEDILNLKITFKMMFDNYTSENEKLVREFLKESRERLAAWRRRIGQLVPLNKLANEIGSGYNKIENSLTQVSSVFVAMTANDNELAAIIAEITIEVLAVRKNILLPEKKAIVASLQETSSISNKLFLFLGLLGVVIFAGASYLFVKNFASPVKHFEHILSLVTKGNKPEKFLLQKYIKENNEIGTLAKLIQRVNDDYTGMLRLIDVCALQHAKGSNLRLLDSGLLNTADKCENIIKAIAKDNFKRHKEVKHINGELDSIVDIMKEKNDRGVALKIENITNLLNDLLVTGKVVNQARCKNAGVRVRDKRNGAESPTRQIESKRMNIKMLTVNT